MSTGSQVQGTLVSLQSIDATLLSLAHKSKDAEAKKAFREASAVTKSVSEEIRKRKMEMENEEPQYKPQ